MYHIFEACDLKAQRCAQGILKHVYCQVFRLKGPLSGRSSFGGPLGWVHLKTLFSTHGMGRGERQWIFYQNISRTFPAWEQCELLSLTTVWIIDGPASKPVKLVNVHSPFSCPGKLKCNTCKSDNQNQLVQRALILLRVYIRAKLDWLPSHCCPLFFLYFKQHYITCLLYTSDAADE